MRFLKIARGLGGILQQRDIKFLAESWPRLSEKKKQRVDDEVTKFLAGKNVKIHRGF